MTFFNLLIIFAFCWVWHGYRKDQGDEMGLFGSWQYLSGCLLFGIFLNLTEYWLGL